MSVWNIPVTDDLDERVKSHLARQGGDLAAYVNKAVNRQLMRETIHTIRGRSVGENPEVIDQEIAQALDEVRADRP